MFLNTNYQGGILSDPILLRLAEDHWWYSISDSDLLLWAMGVAGKDKYDIELRGTRCFTSTNSRTKIKEL